MQPTCLARIVLAAVLALLPWTPTRADWLATTDGRTIETAGPWEQRGRLVVYTTSDGVLSSIRASSVDIEESVRLTDAATAPRPQHVAPAPSQRPDRLVITNRDVGPGRETVPRILMYSAEWCGYCTKARELLRELGADFYEKDVDRLPSARRELIELEGEVSVPFILFDETSRDGFETRASGYSVTLIEAMAAEQKAAAAESAREP